MLQAIHKASGKIVSSFMLRNSLEWQGKEKEEYIAPYHEVDNWDQQRVKGINECKVIYVRRHKRYEDTDREEVISEHFRIETDGFIENRENESEEHKFAKKYIYDNWENLIVYNFDNKKISELANLKDIRIERGIGQKRVDVLIKFDKWHEILGYGIAFEIQISPQREDKTILRSYDRATYGYSVCWLWSEDLRNFKNNIKIIPYRDALKEYEEITIYEQDKRISDIAQKAKSFTEEQRLKIVSIYQMNEKILDQINLAKDINLEDFKKYISKATETLSHQLDNEREKLISTWREIINDKIATEIKNLQLKELLESYSKSKLDNLVNESKFTCSYCNSKDTHEYVDCIICFNCKKRTKKNDW